MVQVRLSFGMIPMLLAALVYAGRVLCLVMYQPRVGRLWDLSVSHQVVGKLFHSVNLRKSARWLGDILENPKFPFQYAYDKQCHRMLTRSRLQDIMAFVQPSLHDRIASPTCLQNSRVTLEYSDIIMLGVSPLKAPVHLPSMDDEAYRRVVSEAIVFGSIPQASCEWLLDEASHRLNFKIPRFLYLIHPECFKEPVKRGQSRGDLGKLDLLLHIIFRSNPMAQCIEQKDFTEYLRWIVRVCLLGLELNRPRKTDDLVDVHWMKDELAAVLADIDVTCISKDEFGLDRENLKVLMLARSLFTAVTKWMFYQDYSAGSRDAGHMPDFDDIWNAVNGEETSVLEKGAALHWKISVFSLYMQLHPGLVPWVAKRLAEFSMMCARIWPLDWISLVRLQLDPISFSNVWKNYFLVPMLTAVAAKSEAVQDYILKWTLHHRDALTRGIVSNQALAIIRAIPLEKRVKYVRRLWLGGEGPHSTLQSIQTLHRLTEPKFKAELITPSQYIRDYFMFLFTNQRIVVDEKTGEAKLVISLPGRVKLLTSMCALALIYDVSLPNNLNNDQITVLLDLNGDGVTVLSNPGIFQAIFPIERELPPRPRRAIIEQENYLASLAAGQRKFHETVPLSGIFGEQEFRLLLGFT